MSVLTKLQCETCSAQLSRNDQFKSTLTCKYCGSTYQIDRPDNQDNDQGNSVEKLISKSNHKAIKPDYLDISSQNHEIQITQSWRKSGSFILLFMAIAWLTLIVNQLLEVWLEGANASFVFLLLFVGVGGLLLYRALSEIFNKSTLVINRQSVTLKTKPFIWKGDFNTPLKYVKYFEIIPPPGPTLSPSSRSFRLCAITKDDRRLTLMPKITNPGHAIYLLREINLVTKIHD